MSDHEIKDMQIKTFTDGKSVISIFSEKVSNITLTEKDAEEYINGLQQALDKLRSHGTTH